MIPSDWKQNPRPPQPKSKQREPIITNWPVVLILGGTILFGGSMAARDALHQVRLDKLISLYPECGAEGIPYGDLGLDPASPAVRDLIASLDERLNSSGVADEQ